MSVPLPRPDVMEGRTRRLLPTDGWLCAAGPLLHANLPTSIAWVVFALVMANVLAYIVSFSNPVIIADAWYFLDAFLSKVADGTLQGSDFFVQRGGFDHAEPLRKAILLFEWKYFALDFRIQAIIGLFCAGGSLLLLRYLVFWKDAAQHNFRSWIWAGMCVALISLNARGVWTWPLVAGGFTSYIFMFALLVAIWKYIDSGSGWIVLLALSALALDFVADKVAILVTIACVLALVFVLVKSPNHRRKAIYAIIALAACLVIMRITYALIYTPPSVRMMPIGTRIERLAGAFVDGGWWQWILIPLGSSVAYAVRLKQIAGHYAHGIQISLGIILLACQVWFWWQAFRTRPNAASFAAIAMMLVFYALLAGILYARIPTFGNNYLNQPRYVVAYSMSNIALLLMCASRGWKKSLAIRPGIIIGLLVTALIIWQVPVTLSAWRAGPYISAYDQNLADQLWQMARNGYKPPANCRPELAVCHYPQARRAKLIKLLQAQHENVFSLRFQRNTKIYPPSRDQTGTRPPR